MASDPEQTATGGGNARDCAPRRHGWNTRRQEGPGSAGGAATADTTSVPASAIGAIASDPEMLTVGGVTRTATPRRQGWKTRRQEGPGSAVAADGPSRAMRVPVADVAIGAMAIEPVQVMTGAGWTRSPAALRHGWNRLRQASPGSAAAIGTGGGTGTRAVHTPP